MNGQWVVKEGEGGSRQELESSLIAVAMNGNRAYRLCAKVLPSAGERTEPRQRREDKAAGWSKIHLCRKYQALVEKVSRGS
jgi:hypothetical protein